MKIKRAQMLSVSALIAGSTVLFCTWGCTSQPTPSAEGLKPAQATQAPAQPASTAEPAQMHAPTAWAAPAKPPVVQPMASVTPPAAPTADTHQVTTIYIVHVGDTLAGISRKYYGTEAKWTQILEANRNVLKSPKDLKPNMRLVIPGANSGATPFSPGGTPSP